MRILFAAAVGLLVSACPDPATVGASDVGTSAGADAASAGPDASALPASDAGADASSPPDAAAAGPDASSPDPGGLECAAALLAIPPQAWHPEGRIDAAHEAAIEAAARTCLSRYLRLDTTNPPSDSQPGEIAAVRFFETVFSGLGLPTRRAPLAEHPSDRRLSVVATMKGASAKGSLVLLNHSDVVAAAGTWRHPPFSGDDDGQEIWGRGALDMKGVGVSQLVALAVLKRAGVSLAHDVHFASVADEEVNGEGADYVVRGDPLGLDPAVVINEGGDGVRDALATGRDFFVIGVEEKGSVWTQVAHAQAPRLVEALARAAILKTPDAKTYADAATRQALGASCTLESMTTGAAQKTNVQPMHVDLALRCGAGAKAQVEAAIKDAGAGMTPAPVLTVASAAGAGGEVVSIAVDTGAGGHGAISSARNALDVAASALVSLGQLDPAQLQPDSGAQSDFFAFALSPANQELVGQLGRQWGMTPGEAAAFVAANPGLAAVLLDVGHGMLPTDSVFRTSCSWTNFLFPVAGEARAKIDCRVDFQHPKGAQFRADLEAFLAPLGVVDRSAAADCPDCHVGDFNASPFGPGTPAYAILRHQVELSSPEVIASAYLFPASSDSATFRAAGIASYGMWPVALTQELLETTHSVDERLPVVELMRAVRGYAPMIHRLSNGILPPARDAAHRLGASDLQCAKRGLLGWTPLATPELTCPLLATTFHCTATGSAPRFLRAVPETKDAKISWIQRLTPDWSEDQGEPTAAQIEKTLFKARGTGADPDVRVFEGQEFEIDTGSASKRQFLLRCATPANVDLLDTTVRFYRH